MRFYRLANGRTFVGPRVFEAFMAQDGVTFESEPLEPKTRRYMGTDLSGKSLLAIRHGGHGDLVMLAPVLDEIKRRSPKARILLATSPEFAVTAQRIRGVDEIVRAPIPGELFDSADYHLILSQSIEGPHGERAHGTDMFAARATITIPEERKRPRLRWPRKQHRKEAARLLRGIPRPLVAIQVAASTPLRSWPREHTIVLACGLAEAGCGVLLLGGKRQRDFELPPAAPQGILNLIGEPSFEASAALIAESQVLVAPDSGLLHLAGSMPEETPSVGLFGPFPARLRTAYYKECIALEAPQAICPQMPCMRHGNQPCPVMHPSPCLNAISPEAVLVTVAKKLWGRHWMSPLARFRTGEGSLIKIPWEIEWKRGVTA